ncbi:MAG: aminopeptidase P family protein [Alphaproteobacteria bacterium]|nr:aminopeptidase P family protein [Alphaproteobacteria bacterium]
MPFLSRSVFDYRLGLMRALMDRNGYDALAFTGEDFFQFATNFALDVRAWERPALVVVPRNGQPFCVLNELSTNHWRFSREAGRIWVEDATFYAEHPRVAGRTWLAPQWTGMVAELLRARGLHRSRIGTDALPAHLARVATLLPGLHFETVTAEMRRLRWVKHAEELALMRAAAELSDWGQERYRENIRPGRLVQELDFAMAALLGGEAARRFPGENCEIRTWTLSGPPSAAPHGDGAPTGATIEKGHVIVNMVIPRLNGLVVENERTWFCGAPSPEQACMFKAATDANLAAIEQFWGGNSLAAIDAAAQMVFEKAGFGHLVLHRTGHGMGTLGHEVPDDMAFNPRLLLLNEVYSCEPGIYAWGIGGFRHDDTVVVGERPEVLTKAPKDIASQTIR